ncbi:AAA family ATPase [Mycobacterium sp. NPDC006124]|uniref:AAA family ATPase n=1 Tax=Mycobacterium sp. NPDC006124 TaxID=3156729 RepID=UPI0033A2D5CF
MEIGDYLRVLQRLWWLLLVTVAVGAGIGYVSYLVKTPEYDSSAQLFVTTQSGSSVGDAYQNNLFSQQRAVSYAGLATSEQVAARAVDQLRASVSAADLRSKITAAAVENTVLLNVTARDRDPALAQTYANAVSVQLVQLVSELETSRRGGTPAAGAIIVDDASYPTKAVGLSLLTRIGLGAAAGLFVGLLLLVLAAFSDTRLRRHANVEAVAGSPLLGSLIDDPERSKVGVIDLGSGLLSAERLRELRTNLLFSRTPDGDRVRVIAVNSPARGEGRSTVAVDLAAAFAESEYSVLLVDGDFINPTLDSLVGLTAGQRAQAERRGLSTALDDTSQLSEAVIERAGNAGFALLPAGPVPASRRQLWASESAPDIIEELRRRFDYVIIDTPASEQCADGSLVSALGDGGIVIARVGRTKNASLRKAIEALASAHAVFLGAVATFDHVGRRELAKQRKSVESRGRSSSANDETEVVSSQTAASPGGKRRAPAKTAAGRSDDDPARLRGSIDEARGSGGTRSKPGAR